MENFRKDFRGEFRGEMDRFREEFRESKSCGCVAEAYDRVDRNSGSEEYHERNLDFHRDSRIRRADDSKALNYEKYEGGN